MAGTADLQLSIAICTHNRFDDLQRALIGLEGQTLAAREFEVLIVDNSTDHAALESFRASCAVPANVRWLFSSPPGLSRARNIALSEARAPIVAFLDDDATPFSDWAEEVVLAFRAYPEAGAVAGPIEAQWSGARPAWIPAKYEACLTVLDLGVEDRMLAPREYGFGANFAVRRGPALSIGGFDEALGRMRGFALLSGEEIALQDKLRVAGHSVRYAARARVLHRMREERLTRDWFRARLAWEAVSASLQDGGYPWADWSRQEVHRAAKVLGLEESIRTLLAPRDAEAFGSQLDVTYHLFALLLAAGQKSSEGLEFLFPPAPEVRAENEAPQDSYRPAAALPLTSRYVFAESRNGHEYLFDLYGDLKGAALVELPCSCWEDPIKAIGYLEASLSPRTRAIFMLTLDPFSLDPRSASLLVAAVSRWRIPMLAIQHRLPETAEQRRTISVIASHLHRIAVFSERLANQLKSVCQIANVSVLPHHPTKFRHVVPGQSERARAAMGIRPDQTVFGAVGEAREGKGIALLLAAIDHIPSALRDSVFFLLAGGARDMDPDDIIEHFDKRRVAARVDLRRRAEPSEYAVLTSGEYADAVAATDFGLLLYQGPQRNVASGVLSDFIWQRKRVLATRESFVGAEVAENSLGLILESETPEALARTITDAVELRRAGPPPGAEFEGYREAHSPAAALLACEALLDNCVDLTGVND